MGKSLNQGVRIINTPVVKSQNCSLQHNDSPYSYTENHCVEQSMVTMSFIPSNTHMPDVPSLERKLPTVGCLGPPSVVYAGGEEGLYSIANLYLWVWHWFCLYVEGSGIVRF